MESFSYKVGYTYTLRRWNEGEFEAESGLSYGQQLTVFPALRLEPGPEMRVKNYNNPWNTRPWTELFFFLLRTLWNKYLIHVDATERKERPSNSKTAPIPWDNAGVQTKWNRQWLGRASGAHSKLVSKSHFLTLVFDLKSAHLLQLISKLP